MQHRHRAVDVVERTRRCCTRSCDVMVTVHDTTLRQESDGRSSDARGDYLPRRPVGSSGKPLLLNPKPLTLNRSDEVSSMLPYTKMRRFFCRFGRVGGCRTRWDVIWTHAQGGAACYCARLCEEHGAYCMGERCIADRLSLSEMFLRIK